MPAHSRLSIIVFSGDYDRVHYALAMAAAAAATNRPVTMFFTMGALRALRRDAGDGLPGWTCLAPVAGGITPANRDADHAAAGIATLEELLGSCVGLGVNVMVCEMGLRAEQMTLADLRSDVPVREGGLVTFLAEAGEDGRVVFV